MPVETNDNINGTAPAFIGLQSYTEAQAGSFFGRDEEISKITTLVLVNTLTIVFGKSGTGKTSVLNAGVFPGLRKNYCLPFKIRLEFNKNSPDLVTQIKKVLKEEIDKYGFKVKAYPASETLWEYFHQEPLWQVITPILVFDQFEEIFTLAKLEPRYALTELPAFWEELSDVIENNIPVKLAAQFQQNKKEIEYNYKTQKTKVVFSFREEYLPEFESITSKIPSIKYSRFRLLPMNGHQAYEVITKTWRESIKPPQAKRIVSYLTNEPNQESYDLVTIEPSLLSQVCANIDKERISAGSNEISADLLDKIKKETILRNIYTEAVTAAEDALPKTGEPGKKTVNTRVQQFLETKLISPEGYRTRYNLAGADDYIRPGIGVLQSRYFIREDDNTVELTHDVVAPIIKEDRDERRTKTVLAAEKKKRRRISLALLFLLLLASGFAYTWITREAKQAEKEARQAVVQLKADSASLVNSKDSLQNKFLEVENALVKKRDSLNNAYATGDFTKVKELTDEIQRLKTASDILRKQKEENDKKITKLDARLKNVGVSYSDLVTNPDKALMSIRTSKKKSVTDFAEYNELVKKYDLLKTEHDKVNYEFDQHLRLYHNAIPVIVTPPVLRKFDTTNSWKLIMGNGLKQPAEMPITETESILLIPDIPANRAIIKKAKAYDINCNSVNKAKVTGLKTATYYNGDFYFADVPKGDYLIKICSYYGGYYVRKKNNNMDSVRLGGVRAF